MKTTIGALLNTEQPMSEILKERIPAVVAYKLGSLVKEVQSVLIPFNDAKKKMFDDWGEKNGNEIKIKPEFIDEFVKEMDKLLAVEVELKYKPISILELKTANVSALAMANLQDYFILEENI